MSMQFDLVSPEEKLASLQADALVLPAADGDIAALPGHAPLMTVLRAGVIAAHVGDSVQGFAVTGGFAEITPEGVTVLAEEAMERAQFTRDELQTRIAALNAELEAVDEADKSAIAARVLELRNLEATYDALPG